MRKQLPLVFVFMTGQMTNDYVKVFKALGRLMDGDVRVTDFVVDFETALWGAIRQVFVGADIHRYAFHLGQAVWRQIQAKNLATEYMEKKSTYEYLWKLMCLPFLPVENITPVFEALADLAADHHQPLIAYIRRTWIRSTTWPVTSWSVFGQSVRTNNDVEDN